MAIPRLAKDPLFQSQHVFVPTHGVALSYNAFEFPSWGFWGEAAPALFGRAVIVKPATSTAWLTQRMVEDVVNAGIFPAGAISVVCGRFGKEKRDGCPRTLRRDLVHRLRRHGRAVRMHPAVARRSVRVNIEADSVNSALIMPDATPGSEAFDLMIKEVARDDPEIRSGMHGYRRAFVHMPHYAQAAEVAARLAKTTIGNPRNEAVRMGALVSHEPLNSVRDGIAQLSAHTDTLYDGRQTPLIDADPSVACCIGTMLLGTKSPASVSIVHEVEVFGPVATLRGL
jgi:3,4-dehydroadipyl-CoA semialdehyde dehydrogenase